MRSQIEKKSIDTRKDRKLAMEDLRQIAENLPQQQEQQDGRRPAPKVVVTCEEMTAAGAGSSTHLLYSRSPSPTTCRLASRGIDSELQKLLDADPGLIGGEIKRTSRSFQPEMDYHHHQEYQQQQPWYSLPEETGQAGQAGVVRGGFDNFVASPNVVERVRAQAVPRSRYLFKSVYNKKLLEMSLFPFFRQRKHVRYTLFLQAKHSQQTRSRGEKCVLRRC